MKTIARLYVDLPLTSGQAVILPENPSHYLRNVMRVEVGQAVAVFNGHDGEWHAVVDDVSKKAVRVVLKDCTRMQTSEPDVWLLFAPLKKDAIDSLAQKASELGVSKLIPVMTDHTAATRLNTERLKANTIEGAEQTERLSVPDVAEVEGLRKVLSALPSDRVLIFADERGEAKPLKEVLMALPVDAKVAILVGPEGGFSDAEKQIIRKLKQTIPVSLGLRILRADTAAIAMLACFQCVSGDWI